MTPPYCYIPIQSASCCTVVWKLSSFPCQHLRYPSVSSASPALREASHISAVTPGAGVLLLGVLGSPVVQTVLLPLFLRCPLKYLFSLWLPLPFLGSFTNISAPAGGDVCLVTTVVMCVTMKPSLHLLMPVCCLPAIFMSHNRTWGLNVSGELENDQVHSLSCYSLWHLCS